MATRLQDRLIDFRIEWPPGRSIYFIPADVLDSLITYDDVKNELRRLVLATGKDPAIEMDQAAQEAHLECNTKFIYSKAKKIFTILLYIEKLDSISQIIGEGICDDDLPFIRCYKLSTAEFLASKGNYTLCKRSRECGLGSNHRDCGIKEFTNWNQRAIDYFNREQWLVQAPVFEKNKNGSIPHYDLHDNTILPFVDDYELRRDRAVSSGYSHVWGVRIHPAHQKLYDSSHASGDTPMLAIKRLFSRDYLDFQRETDMLRTLAVREHPHLIRLLATYKFKEHYHLVFPYATFHLRNYWNTTGLPNWNPETYLWVINQLRGLASGLSTIHNFSSQTSSQMLQIPGNLGGRSDIVKPEEKFGRHGDIKPENILWFNDINSSTGEGILQIADMGLGRFHRLGSRSRVNPHGLSGSPTYVPPEVALGLHVSRAYDIWSLGCVFIEFITWLLEGDSSVYEFASKRGITVSPKVWDDTYFTTFTNDRGMKEAKVRQGVKDWIIRLQNNERCSQMIHDVLTVVENQMLVVDSKTRIGSERLVRELEQIINRARAINGGVYLLGQNTSGPQQGVGMKQPQQDIHHPATMGADFLGQGSSAEPNAVASPSIRVDQYV